MVGELPVYVQEPYFFVNFVLKTGGVIYGYMIVELSDHLKIFRWFFLITIKKKEV